MRMQCTIEPNSAFLPDYAWILWVYIEVFICICIITGLLYNRLNAILPCANFSDYVSPGSFHPNSFLPCH